MERVQRRSKTVGWGRGLLAGVGAGIVAGAASVATALLLHAQIPPLQPSAWSAFLAAVLGGLVYALWSRIVGRPGLALWITALVLATVISIVEATLPFPKVFNRTLGPIAGLVIPLQQLGALAGLGQFSDRRFPAAFLHVVISQHYVTAVVVSLLVPWWAGRQG